MKIFYVGNFKPRHSTENHLALTLEMLGHTVHRIQEDETGSGYLQMQLESIKPDLFFFTRTWGKTVTMDHLAWLKQNGIPSVSYHLDLYVGLQRDGGIEYDPFWRTDYVFTPDGDYRSQLYFKKMGINHKYMRPGVFEPECIMAQPQLIRRNKFSNPELPNDVLFVGSYHYHPEWPYRRKLIDNLARRYGPRFKLMGHEERYKVRNEDLNQLYANTKVVVGDSLVLGFDHQYYWSDRVYETPGRGGFMIQPFITGIEDEFTEGKNAVFYKLDDFRDLFEKIDYYLANDEEREQIRRAAHEFVKKNCTYTDRLKSMFEVLARDGIK